MGNQLAGTASSMVLPVERYVTDIPDVRYVSSLGSTRFMKVAKVQHSEGPCVAKIFVVHDPSLPLKSYRDQVEVISQALVSAPNCAPFNRVVATDRSGILLRQYSKDTLYDRLSTRPFLTVMGKKWIAFQLLQALEQCRLANVCHGDIKSENVLVTSWNWVLLTDFASFKPAYIPYDNPSDFSYFFDTSRRRICCIAPERFVASSDMSAYSTSSNVILLPDDQQASGRLTHAMDIFSVGCVLAELFTDGYAPFDFSQALLFRKNEYSPRLILNRIDCPHVRELVSHMLQRDPTHRWSAEKYLLWQQGKAFPEKFYSFVWPYMQRFVTPPLRTWDERLKTLDYSLFARHLEAEPMLALVLLPLVTSTIRSVRECARKLEALGLLKQLATHLASDIVLDRILPYMIYMISDTSARVRAAALCALRASLEHITSVPQSDARVFTEYIFEKIAAAAHDRCTLVRLAFAQNLAAIAETAVRFLDYAVANCECDPQIQVNVVQESAAVDYNQELKSIREFVQDNVVTLLCDPDNVVPRCLVQSGLSKLCMLLGKVNTSDSILSHMITFLNDKTDWHLRASFYDAIPTIAAYVGWQTSQVLRPLLQQGLRDFEEMVVCRTLCCLAQLAKLGVLQKPIVYELLADSVPFLAHPNAWLRIASVTFVCAATESLSLADVHCKVIPLVNAYLRHPLIKLDRQSVLLQSLREPISRSIYDIVSKTTLIQELLEFLREKQLVRQLSHKPASHGGGRNNAGSSDYLPQNTQVAQLYQKLIARGMDDLSEERLLAFREIFVKMYKLRTSLSSELSPSSANYPGVVDLSHYAKTSRNSYQFHARTAAHVPLKSTGHHSDTRRAPANSNAKDSSMNEEWQQLFGKTHAAHDGSARHTQQQPDYGDKRGEADSSEGVLVNASLDTLRSQERPDSISLGGMSAISLPQSIESAGDIDGNYSDCRHELNAFLEAKQVEYLDMLAMLTKDDSQDAMSNESERVFPVPPRGWKPSGNLVAHLHEHRAALHRLDVHPNGYLFASCSSDGSTKVWDAQRIEGRSMVNRSRATYNMQGGKIKTVRFLPDGDHMLVTSDNCTVHLLNIDRTTTRLNSVYVVATDAEKEGPVIATECASYGSSSHFVTATHHGAVLGWDPRVYDHRPVWKFVNPSKKGLVTSMCVDRSARHWVCLGTDSGNLVTWDLRFRLAINNCQHPSCMTDKPIVRLWPHPSKPSCVLTSVADNGEVSIWDLESCARITTLWSVDQPVLSYQQTSGVTTAAAYHSRDSAYPFVLTGNSLGEMRFWNLKDFKESCVVSMPGHEWKHKSFLYKPQIVDGVQVCQEMEVPLQGRKVALDSAAANASPLGLQPATGHHDSITDMVMCHTSQWLMVTASRDGVIKVWK